MDRDERRSQRFALIDRLRAEDAPDLYRRLENCGQEIPMTCTHCAGDTIATSACMARYCPECRPRVTAERVARWSGAMASMSWPLFMTLTIPNSRDPESLRFLRKKWGAFRRRKLIRSCIVGGVATFEITNIGNGWHPHLHAMADCEWLALAVPKPTRWDSPSTIAEKCHLAKAELSALWAHQIGSPLGIVQAKRVPRSENGNYVLKYAAKSSDLISSPDPIAPMLRVLRSTRTISGWGSLHPLPSPDDDLEPECRCKLCGMAKSTIPSEVAAMISRSREPYELRAAIPAASRIPS